MSDSTDNTNELDTYGVWVKHGATEENKTSENLDDSLDIPDFDDDSDFSDMFKDDSQFVSETEDGINAEETLTEDELANITNGSSEITFEETTIDASETIDDSIDSSFADSLAAEEPVQTEEESPVEATEEINIENFDAPAEDEEETFGEDEEISLDDFMEDGFSDESVAAGNNGFAAGEETAPSSGGSEEISLDDFLDGDSFEMPEAPAAKKEEVIPDTPPLEMDIAFDDSAEQVETVENNEANDLSADDDFDSDYEDESSAAEEKVEEEVHTADTSVSIDTEEIDLSDFGIDEAAEETPITQNVDEAKSKDVVVDYDLNVGNANETAPIVNQIKDIDETEKNNMTEEPKKENVETVSTSLLQQIVNDLSGLKNEINELKTNLAELRARENTAVVSSPVSEPAADESLTEEEFIEETIPEETLSSGGFFGDDDGDDTIALSSDELSNILTNANFEETVAEENPQDDSDAFAESTVTEENPVVEDTVTEESIEEETIVEENQEPVFEETAVDEAAIEEPVFEETALDEAAIEEPVFEESPAEETIIEETPVEETVIEESPLDDSFGEETVIEDTVTEETSEATDNFFAEENSDMTYNFDEDNLEEPDIENIEVSEEALEENEDDLPSEISIPKDEEMFVESSSDDFMESVAETTTEAPAVEEPIEESAAEIEEFDDAEIIEETIDEPIEETSVEEPVIEEPVIEEPIIEEPVIEETVTENITEETASEDDDIITVDSIIGSTPDDISEDNGFASVDDFTKENTSEETVEETIEAPEEESFASTDDFLSDDNTAAEEIAEETVEENAIDEAFASVTDFTEEALDETEPEPAAELPEDYFAAEPASEPTEEDSFASVDAFAEETPVEEAEQTVIEENEPVFEETTAEESEPVFEEALAEESAPAVEETIVEEETPEFEETSVEIDEEPVDETESNINYLTEKSAPTEDNSSDFNSDLKKDIKSVLLYMDQLLENLPEEKIIEFAKSDEFTTYKKLFSELGLS